MNPKSSVNVAAAFILLLSPNLAIGQAPAIAAATSAATVDVRGDGGVQAVQQAQAQAAGGGNHYQAGASADVLIKKWLKEGRFQEGWDDARQRYIAVGKGEFNSEDPSIDPATFCVNREIAAQRALLDARSQIVEFANSKLDVLMQAQTPGTDLNAAFGEQEERLQRQLAAQQQAVALLLADLDQTGAEALRGATTRDRVNALMDAAIKRLDAIYSREKIEEEKRARYERAKTRYQQATQELAKVEAEIRKQAGAVTRTFSNKITKLAKMPLFGSSCIYQTEAWSSLDEKYTVVVALVWSVGLEKATRAIVQGQEVTLDAPKKGVTLAEWLEGQDLGAMVGPRTFMDEHGERYFIGIAARAVVKGASRMEKNRDVARLMADQMTVLSLRADVEVAKTAEQLAKTVLKADGREEEQALESLSKTIVQKLEGQNLNGLSRVHEGEVEHPLTRTKLLVTISGIGPESVKAARTIEEINYAAAIAANRENVRLQGRKDVLEASKQASKDDPASYGQGRQNGADAVDKQTAARTAEQEKKDAAAKAKSKTGGGQGSETLDGAVGAKPKKSDDDF
jgi:hypothetical protein